jgi:hypothetical protein
MSKNTIVYTIFMIFLVFTFLLGMFVYAKVSLSRKEGMEGETDDKSDPATSSPVPDSCPDMLIQDGNTLKLYNSKVPDKEPVVFASLEDYLKYVSDPGNNCPIMFLRKEINAQGQDVYRVRPNPIEQEGGLPTPDQLNAGSRPYDGNYPGFDPTSMYVGRTTELDVIHASTENEPISDNPMDSNWGGVMYSVESVKSGKYVGNEVGPPRGLVSLTNGNMPGLVPGHLEPPVDQI